MKVREARVERSGCVRAWPAPARRFFRAEVFSGMLCIPVVKFVRGNLLTCAAEKIVLLRFAPTEVSISSITAIFGAPIVIYMMIHRKAA